VLIWNRLQPFILQLKQLVITSRKLDTDTTYLQLLSIKDAMTKKLSIGDIDPLLPE
jgi:hypothetical protein